MKVAGKQMCSAETKQPFIQVRFIGESDPAPQRLRRGTDRCQLLFQRYLDALIES